MHLIPQYTFIRNTKSFLRSMSMIFWCYVKPAKFAISSTTKFHSIFCMEYKGPVTSFLGLNIIRDGSTIAINQVGYIEHMLARFQMDKAKPAATPLHPGLPLLKAKPGDKRTDIQSYQELTGSLNHAAVFSRPDISFAVSKLSQFNSDPTETHMKAARHVLAYLKGTINYCIVYGDAFDAEIHAYTRAIHYDDYLSILGFADADHAADKNDRKSQTGYVFLINNGAVVWESHMSLSQQGTLNIWPSLMLQGKQLHVFTYIPTFRLSLIDLRYYIATVLRPCCSPTNRRLIKGINTSILDVILYGIYYKREKSRWTMYPRRKIRWIFSQRHLVRIYMIIVFSEWVSDPFILGKVSVRSFK